jgi:hypothetical protein
MTTDVHQALIVIEQSPQRPGFCFSEKSRLGTLKVSHDYEIYPKRAASQHSGRPLRNPATYILAFVATVAGAGAIYTLYLIDSAWESMDASLLYKVLPYWVIGPPIWFWCDYFLVYRTFGDPKAFDSFKHAQHVSLAIWASIGLLLAAIVTSDRFKQGDANRPAIAAQHAPAASAPQHRASPEGSIK